MPPPWDVPQQPSAFECVSPRGPADPWIGGETEARSGGEKCAQGCSKPAASWTVLDVPWATGVSWNTDVASKASVTEQPRRRRRRQREAPSLAAINCPLLFIYIIYMYVFVYDFFYYKYRAQTGPGSGGGVSCWSVPTQEQGWGGDTGRRVGHFFTSHTRAWVSPTAIPVPMPGAQSGAGVPAPVQCKAFTQRCSPWGGAEGLTQGCRGAHLWVLTTPAQPLPPSPQRRASGALEALRHNLIKN